MENPSRIDLYDCVAGDTIGFDHIPDERFLVLAARVVRYESTESLRTDLQRSVVVLFGSTKIWHVPYQMMDDECTLLARLECRA